MGRDLRNATDAPRSSRTGVGHAGAAIFERTTTPLATVLLASAYCVTRFVVPFVIRFPIPETFQFHFHFYFLVHFHFLGALPARRPASF